jgi:fused signal recognition particle receptor
MVLGRQRQSPN